MKFQYQSPLQPKTYTDVLQKLTSVQYCTVQYCMWAKLYTFF